MGRYALGLILAFALVGLALTPAGAMAEESSVLPPGDPPSGHTCPILDANGAFCANEQEGEVWFLAGSARETVTRSCTVARKTALRFPVVHAVDRAVPQDPPERSTAFPRASLSAG